MENVLTLAERDCFKFNLRQENERNCRWLHHLYTICLDSVCDRKREIERDKDFTVGSIIYDLYNM